MEFLDATFYGNPLRQWVIALAAGLATYAAQRMVLRAVRGRLARMVDRTTAGWDNVLVEAVARTKALFLLLVAVYVAAVLLELPARIHAAVQTATVLMLVFQSGLWVSTGLTAWLHRQVQRELQSDRSAATTVSALGFVGKIILWTSVALVALDNLGVEITTLVAGLGVGGIAVALALQNVLGDLFASLSIVLDKPFVLGDFVIVDDYPGSVEHIGLKTTRIRSLWGEQVVFSNGDLLKARLRNFGRMHERRIAFEIGVTYQTPRDQLAKIPAIIREAVQAQDRTRFDRSHFRAYGDFALLFESVYYVLSPDYNVYMDIQQAINLRIHERFEEEGIEFAYPTQTLFLARTATHA